MNVLFWTLWLGYRGLKLEPGQLDLALRAIHNWDHHYILPLRQLRRKMKIDFGTDAPAIEAVRTKIKQAELLAEKHVQELLMAQISIDSTNTPAKATTLMAENLWLYVKPLGVTDARCAELLDQLT